MKEKGLALLLALCTAVSGMLFWPFGYDMVKAEGDGDKYVENVNGEGYGYWYHEIEGKENEIEITGFISPDLSEETGNLEEGYEKLPKVTISIPATLDNKKVARIGDNALTGVNNAYLNICVENIVVPEGVESIGTNAFRGCKYLKNLTLPDSLITIENYIVDGSSLEEITVPKNVTNIQEWAFDGCESLTAIRVAEENTAFISVDGVLYNKDKSTLLCCPQGMSGEFTIPESVTKVGAYAFMKCRALADITITQNVKEIGNAAFSGLSLTQFTVPGNVKIIGESAFNFCQDLKKIILEEGIEEIRYEAFNTGSIYEDVEAIMIPASVTSLESSAFDWNPLPAINVAEGNKNYASEDGILYDKNKENMLKCPEGKSGEAKIPESVSKIEIDTVFERCEKLTGIIVDPANENYSSEDGILYDGAKGTLLFCPKGKIKNKVVITVPDSVICVDEHAFDHESGWPSNHVTLRCYEGSPAQAYAEKYGMGFEASREAYTYTITFDANGGTNVGAASLTVTEGKTFRDMGKELPEASQAGYDFQGWYTAKAGGTKVTAETRFTGNQTVYAHWEQQSSGNDSTQQPGGSDDPTQQPDQPVKYTVIFHKNGGSKISESSITAASGQKIGKLPTAQRKGYAFEGWYTAKKRGTKIISSTKVTKNQTVYARWKKVTKPKKAGKPSLKSPKGGQLTVSYKKISGAKGYEICCSVKKNFKGARKVTTSKTKATIRKLKKRTVYYVKVRAYKVDSAGGKVYGSYGAFRKLKIK